MSNIDDIKIRRLDFGLLLVLRELLRHRRTTDVAKRLGLSQSAISHALARLRDLTGDPLFIRRHDGLRPTNAALALLPQVEALLAGGQALLGARGVFDPATSAQRFRLAANDFVASVLAPSLRRALAREAPGVRFTIHSLVGADAVAALQRGEIDLTVGRFLSRPDDCTGTLLADEDYALVARAGHPALDPALDVASYCALAHVMVSFRGGLRGTVDEALDRIGARRQVAASVPTFFTALAMVADSDLVATVPHRLAHRHAARFGLALKPPPFAIPTFETWQLRRNGHRDDGAIDWMAGMVERCWAGAASSSQD